MKPVNICDYSAYQEHVLTQLRKYYPYAASSLSPSTWDILEKFWNFDLSAIDSLMQDCYSVFGPEPRLPSDMLRSIHPPKEKSKQPKKKDEKAASIEKVTVETLEYFQYLFSSDFCRQKSYFTQKSGSGRRWHSYIYFFQRTKNPYLQMSGKWNPGLQMRPHLPPAGLRYRMGFPQQMFLLRI